MKKLVIFQWFIIALLLFLYLVDPWNFNRNIRVNFAISDLVDYSIGAIESGNTEVLENRLHKIKKELPTGGYESHYMESIKAINNNIPNKN